jgi:hypothetical protein
VVKYNIQSHPFNILTENKIEEVLNTSFDFEESVHLN